MENSTIQSWSKYFLDLPPGSDVTKCYEEKMNLAGFHKTPTTVLQQKEKEAVQLYLLNGQTAWPDISWPDIYNYLILIPGVAHEKLSLTRV